MNDSQKITLLKSSLSLKIIECPITSREKKGTIRELLKFASEAKQLDSSQIKAVAQNLARMEEEYWKPTSLLTGFAFHRSRFDIQQPFAILGYSPSGVKYDDTQVKIVLLLLCPMQQAKEYLDFFVEIDKFIKNVKTAEMPLPTG